MAKPKSIGKQAYDAIAEELSDPRTKLSDLVTAEAEEWAKRNKKRWPPKPIITGWQITHFGR